MYIIVAEKKGARAFQFAFVLLREHCAELLITNKKLNYFISFLL
jgi:hypothetical protein